MLDELMVATQHLIGWEEGAAELARLRRMADAYAKSATDYRGTNTCAHCRRFTYPGTAMSVPHTATCDVAIHLGLQR